MRLLFWSARSALHLTYRLASDRTTSGQAVAPISAEEAAAGS